MKVFFAVAGVVLLTLLVFAPVRKHGFVSYDDPAFVTEHPVVTQGLTLAGVRWVFQPVNGYSAAGGPLAWLSHMLDVELFGITPGPHHLVNLGLHALNSALLLVILWRMTGAVGRSTCVAALFAIHPLHVESVAWVFERKDVLSTTFWMFTMLAYIGYVRRPTRLRYAAVFALLTAGLMTKPTVVTLPFVLLLLDVWPLRRLSHGWRPLIVEKIPLLIPVIAAMYFTVAAQQSIGAVAAARAIPWALRLENIVVSYATYLLKTVWPARLAVFYPYPAVIPVWTVAASLAAIGAISIVAWRNARTRPFITVGWLWYIVTLIPMIGLIQVGSHSMADRFTYVPLIGVFIAAVWSAEALAARWRIRRTAVVTMACVVVLAASVTASAQVRVWRDSESLWAHALAATQGNFRAYAGLAELAAARDDTSLAISYYKEAVRLAPDAAEWHVNLGLLQSRRNEWADAAASFQRALQLRPDDAETENNLGAMLVRLDRLADAVAHYQRALAIRPAYALARRNLGLAYATAGDLQGGTRELLGAIELAPNEGQWHYEVAVMLLRDNRAPEGIAHLREAVRLSPNHRAARDLLSQLGR